MVMVNTDNSYVPSGRNCYICGVDLVLQYKKDAQQNKNNNTQQNDLNASVQKFPEMIRWDGKKKEVCGSCYKCIDGGLKTYEERHPEFVRPKPIE